MAFPISLGSFSRILVSIYAVIAAAAVGTKDRAEHIVRKLRGPDGVDTGRLRREVRWSKFQAVLGV